jgi:hypothetical protein
MERLEFLKGSDGLRVLVVEVICLRDSKFGVGDLRSEGELILDLLEEDDGAEIPFAVKVGHSFIEERLGCSVGLNGRRRPR